MARDITTSIRLSPLLRTRLDKAAHTLHRGRSWIIVHALEAYLEKLHFISLAGEARRQSLLASKSKRHKKESDFWEENSDTAGWK